MNNYDYPLGADNKQAPWNQIEPKPIPIEIEVSAWIKKTVTVEVSDYTVDEDGINFSSCDFKEAVNNQVDFPKDWEVLETEIDI